MSFFARLISASSSTYKPPVRAPDNGARFIGVKSTFLLRLETRRQIVIIFNHIFSPICLRPCRLGYPAPTIPQLSICARGETSWLPGKPAATMTAIEISSPGSADVLKPAPRPLPQPGADDVSSRLPPPASTGRIFCNVKGATCTDGRHGHSRLGNRGHNRGFRFLK